jgi:hypothetical protein
MRLTGAKSLPVPDLVAIRIVELARAGEFDPDTLTETVLAEFAGQPPAAVMARPAALNACSISYGARRADRSSRAPRPGVRGRAHQPLRP